MRAPELANPPLLLLHFTRSAEHQKGMRTTTMIVLVASLLAALVPGAQAQSASVDKLVPVKIPLAFIFSTPYDSSKQVPECASFDVNYTVAAIGNYSFTSTPPYMIFIVAEGYPLGYASTNASLPGAINVVNRFPEGARIQFTMVDGTGHTGGVSDFYTVVAPNGSACDSDRGILKQEEDAITWTSPTPYLGYSCDSLALTVSERPSLAPPYSVFLLSGSYPNADIYFASVPSSSPSFEIDVNSVVPRSGLFSIFLVSDTGVSSVHQYYNGANTSRCSGSSTSATPYPSSTSLSPSTSASPTPTPSPTPAPRTESSTNLPAVIGGAVGGIGVAALLASLIFCFARRRRQHKSNSPEPTRIALDGEWEEKVPNSGLPETPESNDLGFQRRDWIGGSDYRASESEMIMRREY